MAENALWYVVQTYSGYENAVLTTINKHVDSRNLHDQILEVKIPMETYTVLTDNGPEEKTRKLFPGYVFLKMVLTDQTWHIVRNVRGVTAFTGFVEGGQKAQPLTPSEVVAWGLESALPIESEEVTVSIQIGDRVEIIEGPFQSFEGIVEEIDLDKGRVRIAVLMGGRETPFDMDLDQVRLILDD